MPKPAKTAKPTTRRRALRPATSPLAAKTSPTRVPAETEAKFQATVLALATQAGWLSHHSYDSRRSAPGFPDLVLCKPGHAVVYAELKTAKGRLRPAQRDWLEALATCPGVVAYLWRPADWPAIEHTLTA